MRIDALDLRAFGPFTGQRLDFSMGNAGLHVVYGPNEAGKSSALRALADALYGIPPQTGDDFVHAYQDLRVGMALRFRDGATLAFVRRKAVKAPLWDAADATPLAADVLERVVGGVDRAEFRRVFGLDHVRLREGAAALLEQRDGAAAAIVGSGLGIPDLRRVQAELGAAATELYSPRARKKPLNDALRIASDARKAILDASTTGAEWERAVTARAAAAAALDDARARNRAIQERVATLERVARVREPVGVRRAARARLDELAAVPDLDEQFVPRRVSAEGQLREAMARIMAETDKLAAVDARLAELPERFAMLDAESELAELQERAAAVAKALVDVGKLSARRDALRDEQAAHAATSGVRIDAGEVARLRVAVHGKARMVRLAQQNAALVERLRTLDARRTELDELLVVGVGVDASAFARLDGALREARRLGEVDAQLAVLDVRAQRAAAALDEQLARFCTASGFGGDLAALARAPFPGDDTLDGFRRRFDDLDARERGARERLARHRADREAIDAEERAIRVGGDVPLPAELDTARGRRDALWQLVRRAWLGGEDVDAVAAALLGDADLPAGFERSVHDADRIGDLLRSASEQVAQRANCARRRETTTAALESATVEVTELAAERAALDAAWRDAWAAAGIVVAAPQTMREHLGARATLLELRESACAVGDEVAALAARRAAQTEALTVALEAVGVAAVGDVPFAGLLATAERSMEQLAAVAAERERATTERRKLEREHVTQTAALDEWRREWDRAVADLPVVAGASPDHVLDVVDAIEKALELHDRIDELAQRIERIHGDETRIRADLVDFAARVAIPVPTGELRDGIRALGRRVDGEREQRAARNELLAQRTAIAKDLRDAETVATVARTSLDELRREARLGTDEAFSVVEARATEKRRVRVDDDAATKALLREGARSLDELAALVEAHVDVDVPSALAALATEAKAVAAAVESATRTLVEAQQAVEAIDAAPRAARAAEDAQDAIARTRTLARDWAQRALAARLLQLGVERYRQANEAPVLRLAGRRLEGLTRGRYTALRSDVDEKGAPFLEVRAHARERRDAWLGLERLSDGTRDQLHLALVLASLEHRFGHEEPRPLVLDDVLVHFDDARSAAALAVLAEFGAVAQVLLFTHHARIREQAEALGAARGVFVHALDGPTQP